MVFVLIGALIIGLTLGLLGSGGSALTVPVLVYLVGHATKQSIAESMAIVGLISVAAAIPYARGKQIDWRSVWYFGIPGMLGTFIGAWLGGLSSAALQLIVLGGVLIGASYAMLRKPKSPENASYEAAPFSSTFSFESGKYEPDAQARELRKFDFGSSESAESAGNPLLARRARMKSATSKRVSEDISQLPRSPIWKIAIEGTIVGVITGFVGVGGGFLIVPALVVFGRLPMRLAIGTSLIIIAMKSAIGFAKYQQYLMAHDMSVDIQTVAIFVAIGVVGSLIGKSINAQLNQRVLKQVFAVFLILLGGFVIVREGSRLVSPEQTTAASTVQSASDTALNHHNEIGE